MITNVIRKFTITNGDIARLKDENKSCLILTIENLPATSKVSVLIGDIASLRNTSTLKLVYIDGHEEIYTYKYGNMYTIYDGFYGYETLPDINIGDVSKLILTVNTDVIFKENLKSYNVPNIVLKIAHNDLSGHFILYNIEEK